MKQIFIGCLLILIILVLAQGCSSNSYVTDCYNNKKLEFRKISKYLFNVNDTSKYDECHVYRITK